MDIPEGDIGFACTRFGARTVFNAAHMCMAGYHRALPAVGLPDTASFDEAERIGRVSYRLMKPAEREAVIAEAAAGLDTLPQALEGFTGYAGAF